MLSAGCLLIRVNQSFQFSFDDSLTKYSHSIFPSFQQLRCPLINKVLQPNLNSTKPRYTFQNTNSRSIIDFHTDTGS
ncbi:hypothetical protein ABKN59_005599 [Abortiporus biennis]